MAEHNYLNTNITLMLYGATFRIQTKNKIKKIVFYFWRVLLNLVLLYLVLAVSVDLNQKDSKDLKSATLNFLCIGIGISTWFKLNYFYVFDEISEGLVKDMHHFFKYETQTGLEEKSLRHPIDLCRKFTILWSGIAAVAGISLIILPLFFSRSVERILPLPMWFQYDWKISPFYELTIFYQIFVLEVIGITMSGTDIFFANVVLLTAKQFEFLGWEIKHILQTTLIRNGVSKENVLAIQMLIEENPHMISQQIQADVLKYFGELIQFHQFLLKFCSRLEDFFSLNYLPYFLCMIVLNIFDGFMLALVEDVAFAMTFSFYVIGSNTSLFLPCFFGQLLTTQTEALPFDVYESLWYVCDEKFKVHFKCFHLKTCMPVYITVGKFANLSLNALSWILQTTVSYVVVLYQLTHANNKH